MVVLSPILVMGCDCYKAHVACNEFAAKRAPRQGRQMQSLKGHKITLIAAVDLLRWDNDQVSESCLRLKRARANARRKCH